MSPLAEQVQRLATAVALGKMTGAIFVSVVLPLLAMMRARTAVAAETRICKQIKARPYGLWLPDETEHYRASLETVLTDDPSNVGALVQTIEQDARHAATTKAMRVHHVQRYRLAANPDACDKCREDDGKTYPITNDPSHHNNCRCEAIPLGEPK